MASIEKEVAAMKIYEDLCLSCVYKPNIKECHLIRSANGGREPILYCKSAFVRATYDRLTGKCTCTSFKKKGVSNA